MVRLCQHVGVARKGGGYSTSLCGAIGLILIHEVLIQIGTSPAQLDFSCTTNFSCSTDMDYLLVNCITDTGIKWYGTLAQTR